MSRRPRAVKKSSRTRQMTAAQLKGQEEEEVGEETREGKDEEGEEEGGKLTVDS